MIASEVFTSDITLRAGLTAGAALVVLILVSNNRPARTRAWVPVNRRRQMPAMRIERLPVQLYRAPRWWERLAAVTGLSVVAAVVGAVTATMIAAVLIYGVTTLTGLLK